MGLGQKNTQNFLIFSSFFGQNVQKTGPVAEIDKILTIGERLVSYD
jgi:hypothetical protein